MELSATFMARRWQDKPEEFDRLIGSLKKFMSESDKPFLAALHPSHVEEAALTARQRLQEEGIATFPSFERAANALEEGVGVGGCLTDPPSFGSSPGLGEPRSVPSFSDFGRSP